MSPRTIFLSRLIGLYYVIVGLSMAVHKQATVATITAVVHDQPVLFIACVIALGTGLAMVLGHNVWSGGALPVVVTLVGWITLIKGLLVFLVLSPEADMGAVLGALQYERLFYLYAGISLIIGVYLTYGGFTSTAHQRTSPQPDMR
jgi:uncharacterized membrane protein